MILDKYIVKRLTADMPPDIFEALSALDRSCFTDGSWSADDFYAEAKRSEGVVLAVYCDDSLAGLLAGFTASDTGEILTLATAPEHRRRGVARRLMEEFFSNIPAVVETIALEVRQSNSAAIALYESFGFKKAGIRRRFYSDPEEDANVMVKKL